jgi:hypothetical protein
MSDLPLGARTDAHLLAAAVLVGASVIAEGRQLDALDATRVVSVAEEIKDAVVAAAQERMAAAR